MLFWFVLCLCWWWPAVALRPNFLIILTDDQDVVLNGMQPMKLTQQLVANEGVTFVNAVSCVPCTIVQPRLMSAFSLHLRQFVVHHERRC